MECQLASGAPRASCLHVVGELTRPKLDDPVVGEPARHARILANDRFDSLAIADRAHLQISGLQFRPRTSRAW
jgi:hypothetical protein